jgi:hypothetical protein
MCLAITGIPVCAKRIDELNGRSPKGVAMEHHSVAYAALAFAFGSMFTTPAAAQEVTDSIPPITQADFTVNVRTIADGFTAPNLAIAAPGLRRYLFVVDQTGELWRVHLPARDKTLFLNLSSLLLTLGIPSLGGYDERGFLGVAFSPDFSSDGLFYTYTSEPVVGPADFTFPERGLRCPSHPPNLEPEHQNLIREWHVAHPLDPNSRPDSNSRVVLRINWGNFNHDGGMLAFGPDGMLYAGLGDGGGEDDQTCQIGVDGKPTIGHSLLGNGQNPRQIYGKIIRIDPRGRNSRNAQYGIPADNPYIGRSRFLPEIFAYGLRNPFRFSFDPESGKVMGNDVGQNYIEEINELRPGNFGWRIKEGTFLFNPARFAINGFVTDGYPVVDIPGLPGGFIDPIAQYAHFHKGMDQGKAGIGGFVYRGHSIRELRGLYVFGDYSQNRMDPIGRLLILDHDGHVKSIVPGTLDIFVLGLGRDARGRVYVLGNKTGRPLGNTGVVQRIVPSYSSQTDSSSEDADE